MSPSGRFNHRLLYWTVWDRFMQVLYLRRATHTKETLPDFLKWRPITRHPLVFRGLTGCQRTPGNGASHFKLEVKISHQSRFKIIVSDYDFKFF